MNKMIIILAVGLLLIPVSAIAEMHGSLELGQDIKWPLTFVDIELNYSFDIWIFETSIFGGVITYFDTEGIMPVAMKRSIYPIGCLVQYENFYFKIKHFCNHPTISPKALEKYLWTMSGTTVSIGIEF